MEEPSQFAVDQTSQSLTHSIIHGETTYRVGWLSENPTHCHALEKGCLIRKCTILFNQFISGLDNLTASKRHSGFFRAVDLGEVVGCLEDLITYFAQPEDDLGRDSFEQ